IVEGRHDAREEGGEHDDLKGVHEDRDHSGRAPAYRLAPEKSPRWLLHRAGPALSHLVHLSILSQSGAPRGHDSRPVGSSVPSLRPIDRVWPTPSRSPSSTASAGPS